MSSTDQTGPNKASTEQSSQHAAQGASAGFAPGEILRPHEYDGIMEYDNPPPMWLQLIFYATVLFSVVYIPYYLMGYINDNDTPQTWLAADMAQAKLDREAYKKAHPELFPTASEESLQALVGNAEQIALGQKQYASTCAACHGPEGQGLVGPNLTDNAWIHGPKLLDIRNVIEKGVLEKGMIAWGTQLKPDVIDSLVVYIRSIQGTNPANPKAPQGTVVAEP